MTHEPFSVGGEGGTLDDHKDMEVSLSAIVRSWGEGCRGKLKVSQAEYRKRTSHKQKWWMDWSEALRYGAVDKVVDRPSEVW